ncbi:hypothetical protein AAHE18_11G137600 [Arachis hypogaea]
MAKKKAFIPLRYLTPIVFLPWCISFTFQKSLESWELFLLDEMLKEYPELRSQNLRTKIYKETIQLITTHNEDRIHAILHFSTNILSFVILSGYSSLDLCIGFHSTHGWELMIGSLYKDFGFAQNDQIISGLVSTFPVILDTIIKYWIFRYLNRVSPSLVVIYHSMND